MGFQRIEIIDAKKKCFTIDGAPKKGVKVIDIRDETSFKEGHINSAEHIDNSNFSEFLESTEDNDSIVVYCYHGHMSQGVAAHIFEPNLSTQAQIECVESVHKADGVGHARVSPC